MSNPVSDRVATYFRENGFALVENVIPDRTIEALIHEFESDDRGAALRRQNSIYGERNLLDGDGIVLEVSRCRAVRTLVEEVLGENTFAVRGLFFDKVPGANWNLSWHQDVTIAVAERRDVAGFGPWSMKAGVPHVHAPAPVLDAMVAVRIHLDDCPAENGALQVILGSHRHGRIPSAKWQN